MASDLEHMLSPPVGASKAPWSIDNKDRGHAGQYTPRMMAFGFAEEDIAQKSEGIVEVGALAREVIGSSREFRASSQRARRKDRRRRRSREGHVPGNDIRRSSHPTRLYMLLRRQARTLGKKLIYRGEVFACELGIRLQRVGV